MKRERQHNTIHHFSFGARFDETLMNGYFNGNQSVRLSNHQFIGFSPLNKSAGKATEVSTDIHRQVGRTSALPTDKGKPIPLAKRKRHPMSADTAAGFGEQKAIAY